MTAPRRGELLAGDCIEVMAGLPAESVEAIVTDPPYGLEFMGKDWDRFREPTAARDGRRGGNGSAGSIGHSTLLDTPLPVYSKRRMTSTCLTCGKRDAFRNPHACGEAADWRLIPVDDVNVELRAFQEWTRLWATEAYRVAKPGAWLLAFGGTRTYHRMTSGIEDAGWEIRDCLVWGYASGFPKSLDVSKQLDKRAGATRAVTGERLLPDGRSSRLGFRAMTADDGNSPPPAIYQDTAPSSPEAIAWAGWGTALKPAWEPIVLARKPVIGTVAENVLKHGTGALNIDATRIPIGADDPVLGAEWVGSGVNSSPAYGAESRPAGRHVMRPAPEPDLALDVEEVVAGQLDMFGGDLAPRARRRSSSSADGGHWSGSDGSDATSRPGYDGGFDAGGDLSPLGRWPANVVLTDAIFNEGVEGVVGSTDDQRGGGNPTRRTNEPGNGITLGGHWHKPGDTGLAPIDTGGTYSRFFLIPKADRAEREPVFGAELDDREPVAGRRARRNTHPTVKPVDLMRHLARLVTPPGGTVLDPFLGSGTTALAAEMEGFGWVGIERDPDSVAIATARLRGVQRGLGLATGGEVE